MQCLLDLEGTEKAFSSKNLELLASLPGSPKRDAETRPNFRIRCKFDEKFSNVSPQFRASCDSGLRRWTAENSSCVAVSDRQASVSFVKQALNALEVHCGHVW